MASLLNQLDQQLEQIISNWNLYSTILSIVLVSYLIYPLFSSTEPDTHPFLLARQATASRVRQPGETAIYRSPDRPYGYPLCSGLNVKSPGAPKWSSGKDGDLRDVWRQATAGQPGSSEQASKQVGKVYTLLGKEDTIEHSFEKLSAELNAIGKHLKARQSASVAIYLSNSPELLVVLFATLFYGLKPILIAQEQSLDRLSTILKKTGADSLIVGAGSVPLKDLFKKYDGLKEVVWVVPKSSRHLDWNEVPEGEGGRANIGVWHEIVDEEGFFASTELPENGSISEISGVTVVSPPHKKSNEYEIITYTQKNLTAATAAQINSLPHAHRMSSSDLLLPLLPLTNTYALTITLAALYSNATVALTPVTGRSASYVSAFNAYPKISPTIIIADPISLYAFEVQSKTHHTSSFFGKRRHNTLLTSIQTTGVMPSKTSTSAPKYQQSVRLIYTENVMFPAAIANLRIFTGARIVVGLTRPGVAGAMTQTHMLDYRARENEDAHLGPPLSCVEIKLVDTPGHDVSDDGDKSPEGKLVVKGPAVVGFENDAEFTIEDSIWKMTDSGQVGVVKSAGQFEEDRQRAIAEAVVEGIDQMKKKESTK